MDTCVRNEHYCFCSSRRMDTAAILV
jgi:hypothetical protein